MRRTTIGMTGLLLAGLVAGTVQGQATDADKCAAQKMKVAGKYAFCREKADAKAQLTGDAADYTKCDSKQSDKWGIIEGKYMASCPTSGDQASVQSVVTSFTNCLSGDLAGTPGSCDIGTCNSSLSTCNTNLTTCNGDLTTCNGSLATCNAGTAVAADVLAGKTFSSSAGLGIMGTAPAGSNVTGADGSLVMTIPDGHYSGSKTCTASDTDLVAGNVKSGVNIFGVAGSLSSGGGLLKTGQTQCDQGAGTLGACPGSPAGQDASANKGTAFSYTDNGDGTITDNVTGLMWEKLSDDGTDHDKDNFYTWYTAFTTKIANLNAGGGFAGYTDWRLPNRRELESLVDAGRVNPAIDPAFNTGCAASCTVLTCSCTAYGYWSSTTYQYDPAYAWGVAFYDGLVIAGNRSGSSYVRAVRGGS